MVEKSGFTPGPWEESGSRNIIRTKTYANERGGLSGGVLVAQFWTTPSEADARLMASAPELLEMLRKAERHIALVSGNGETDLRAELNAALSKALGEPHA